MYSEYSFLVNDLIENKLTTTGERVFLELCPFCNIVGKQVVSSQRGRV